MAEPQEVLLRLMEENRVLDRQAEERRMTIATVNLVLASIFHVVLVFVGFGQRLLPLTLWMAFLGLYGLAADLKLYERSRYHILRAQKFRLRLQDLFPTAQIEHLLYLAEQEHTTRSPFLRKLRLNSIWVGVHAVIFVLGIIYTLLSVLR